MSSSSCPQAANLTQYIPFDGCLLAGGLAPPILYAAKMLQIHPPQFSSGPDEQNMERVAQLERRDRPAEQEHPADKSAQDDGGHPPGFLDKRGGDKSAHRYSHDHQQRYKNAQPQRTHPVFLQGVELPLDGWLFIRFSGAFRTFDRLTEAGDEGRDSADQGKEVLQRQFSQENSSQLTVLQKQPNALIDQKKADLLCGDLHHRKGKAQLGGDVGHHKNEQPGNDRAPLGELPSQQGIALDGTHRHDQAGHRRHISQFAEDDDAGHADQGA